MVDSKGGDNTNIIYDSFSGRIFERGAVLGKGTFGKCFEFTDIRSGEVLAGKIISKANIKTRRVKDKIVQEINIHRRLNHKHVVGFRGFFDDSQNIYILLELCRKRTLMELHATRKIITDPEVRYYMLQVLSAIKYLHSNNIIHRDLKLGNIFLDDSMSVKVGDFGLATTIEKTGERKRTLCGTPNYIAPEVLEKSGHGCEVDVWSFGCIIFTLLVGKPPFEATSVQDTYRQIKTCDYTIPMAVNFSARQLLQNIFVRDPAERPTVDEIVQDDFFTKGFTPTELPLSSLVTPPNFHESANSCEPKPINPIDTWGDRFCKKLPFTPGYPLLTLQSQLKSILDNKPVEMVPHPLEELEDPSLKPLVWISTWVDYSDRYGFGYSLSDNSVGVMFVDGTKLVLLGNGITMYYTDSKGSEECFKMTNYDQRVAKKVKLLILFKRYMTILHRTGANYTPNDPDAYSRPPSLITWLRHEKTIVMLLSNGILQINFLCDHTKMILCPSLGAFTMIDRNDRLRTYQMALIQRYGCSQNMELRLRYALRRVNEMLLMKGRPIVKRNQSL